MSDPARRRSAVLRSAISTLVLACLVALLVPQSAQAATPLLGPAVRVGTWNTELAPWLVPDGSPQELAVIDQIAGSRLDVLALQGVWTQQAQDRILADPRVKAAYPYSYATGTLQLRSQVTSVSRNEQENYINCLIGTGVDTRTVVQPATLVDPACDFLGLNVAFLSQSTFECLTSTMAVLANGRDALTAIDLCAAAQGVKYQYGGRAGQLVLSNRPISDTSETAFVTYAIRRVNIFATIGGLRYAFVDGPNNVLADTDPGLGPLQTGALQPQVVQDVVDHAPDAVVGSLNTGPDYQPEGYQLLTGSGYAPPVGLPAARPTFCPTTSSSFAQCAPGQTSFEASNGPDPRTLDHVLSGPTARCFPSGTSAVTPPLSRHIAVTAVCTPVADLSARLTVPASAPAGSSFTATLTIASAGPATARQVASGLTLPKGLTITAAPGGAVTSDRRSAGFLTSSIAAGGAITYPVTITVDKSARGPYVVTAATGALSATDPDLRNNLTQGTLTAIR